MKTSCFSGFYLVVLVGVGMSIAACGKKDGAAESRIGAPSEKVSPNSDHQGGDNLELDSLRKIAEQTLKSLINHSSDPSTAWEKTSKELGKLKTPDLCSLISSLDESRQIDRYLRILALNELADRDVKAALDVAAKLPVNTSAVVAMQLYSRLVGNDPKAVIDWILDRGMNDSASQQISRRFSWELAKNRPEEAYALLRQADARTRRWMGGLMLSELASDDPHRAFEAVSKLPASETSELYSAVILGASSQDGALGFRMVADTKSGKVAELSYPDVFGHWIMQSPKEAGEALAGLDSIAIQEVFRNLDNVSSLVACDPELALRSLDKLVFSKATTDIFTKAARELALKDPAVATNWLAAFPDGPGKGELLRVASVAQTEKNPAESVPGLLAASGDSPYRKDVVAAAAISWGRKNVNDALRYSANLPVADQGLYSSTVLQTAVNRNFDTAVKLIASNNLPPHVVQSQEYSDVVKSAGRKYASANVQKAISWAASLQGPAAESATYGVTSAWAAKDIAAVGNWIGELSAGPARNAAIEALAKQLDSTDPEAARQWRNQIR